MEDNNNFDSSKSNENRDSKLKRVKIPDLNWKNVKSQKTFDLSKETKNQLKEVFDLFAVNNKVNPHNIRNGLRKVGNKIF